MSYMPLDPGSHQFLRTNVAAHKECKLLVGIHGNVDGRTGDNLCSCGIGLVASSGLVGCLVCLLVLRLTSLPCGQNLNFSVDLSSLYTF